jgi:hypothetical protein
MDSRACLAADRPHRQTSHPLAALLALACAAPRAAEVGLRVDIDPPPPEPAALLALACAAPRAAEVGLRVDIDPPPPEPADLRLAVELAEPSGNRALDVGERAALQATVTNRGPGTAHGVVLAVRSAGAGGGITLPSPERLGDLAPGQWRDLRLAFYTNRRLAAGDPLPVRLALAESGQGVSVEETLPLTMDVPQRQTGEMVIAPRQPAKPTVATPPPLTVDVDRQPPAGHAAGPYDVAVVIGNRRYRGAPDVDYAHNDVRVLTRTMGLREDNVLVVEDASLVRLDIDDTPADLPNGAVFTSSQGQQVSAWYPDKRHGLFTYFFLKGLRGAADADHDKRITAGEMAAYPDREVPYWAGRVAKKDQQPQLQGKPDLVLAHLR